MKKMQAVIFKLSFILALFCLFSGAAVASPAKGLTPGASSAALAEADSLFHLKQYTQSLEIYQSLYNNKSYSAAMLIKMAYIQEGLGHIAQSMYYLNLYYLATQDPQALVKLEDVAVKNRLEGYTNSETARAFTLVREYYTPIIAALTSLCVLLLAVIFYQKIKRHQRPAMAFVFLFFFLGLLFAHTYFNSSSSQGIISNPSTYLMEGPSAGSSVVSIVGEGHRVEIIGKKDVWLKVKWADKEAFVKDDQLLKVQL